jgi:membrane protein YdbS with pleckstrin-like domain
VSGRADSRESRAGDVVGAGSVDRVTEQTAVPSAPDTSTSATSTSATSTPDTSAHAADRAPHGRLDPAPGDWRRVSRRYVWVDLVGGIISGLIATAAFTVPFWLTQWPWLLMIPGVVLLIVVVVAAFTPRRVRAIGYRLRDDDLLVRRGIMFQRFAAVPYGRMQLVDINRGPLARALGLAELKLVTAASASNVTIPGLPMADAEELRDRLVEMAESRRAGL